jgi:hypothetical protein
LKRQRNVIGNGHFFIPLTVVIKGKRFPVGEGDVKAKGILRRRGQCLTKRNPCALLIDLHKQGASTTSTK